MTVPAVLRMAREQRSRLIGIVSVPIGRPACILTNHGTVHRGYVPPAGYVLAINEVLFVGREISRREADAIEHPSR